MTRTCDVVTIPGGMRAIKDRASGEVMHCGTGPGIEPSELYVVPSRLEERLRQPAPPLVLFDVGLGAASNALAAWHVSEALSGAARRLEIVSFDRNLDALRLALEPENAAAFGLSEVHPRARAAAMALAEHGSYTTPRTSWRLVAGDFPTVLAREPTASADIVYWDLYSPRSSPELWTLTQFLELRRACRDGATFHTYCSATAVRSALLLAGFAVGLGTRSGDRPTTMAATNVADLATPLDARWLLRLGRSSAAFPPDVPLDETTRAEALARVRAHVQFT